MVTPSNIKNILLGFLIALLLFIGGLAGYKIYPARHPCPEIVSDTIYVHDTITHYIPDTIPYYIQGKDSIVYLHDTIPADVDTMAILKDHYALHYYTRLWEDSLLTVTLKDVITQNKSIDNTFTYKILRPQTVIHNEYSNYSYSRYVTAGLNFLLNDLSYTGIEMNYIAPTWQGGMGYNFKMKAVTAKITGTIVVMK
jgi:hypothetical protein